MKWDTLSALLLLVVGLVNAIPPFSKLLTEATGGSPVIQIVVGIACVITAIVTFTRRGMAS